ncbi:MAG: hypothetical protein LAT84_01835 [Balneolia bacterium]|nr:hypothetical protein [Balneolia bacterium]
MSEPTKVTREQIASFRSLLQELSVECKTLVEHNAVLKAENAKLKKENAKLSDKLAVKGASSGFSQKERLVLKQQLSSMIKRIDHHLEENA